MVRQYILKMGMPIVTNGYALVEMLLVMMLTSVMTVLYLPRSRDINCDDYIFINDYFKKLSISMISNEKINIQFTFQITVILIRRKQ